MAVPIAKPLPVDPAADQRERRQSTRLRVKGLWCDKGQVIDLSARGMRLRVHRRWNEGDTRTLTILDQGTMIPVEARCVWCRQEGLFSHVIGLAFDHVDPAVSEAIERLAISSVADPSGEA